MPETAEQTKVDDGGPAFPVTVRDGVTDGAMTLRDYFAAKLMQAMFTGFAASSDRAEVVYAVCAREAYAAADAMLVARKGPEEDK